MSYTSTPNGLFTYTITGVSDSTELAVIQSAFNKWDSICLIDTTRWGSSYSISVSYSIASLATGILGGASLQSINISQGTTYGNIMPASGTIQLNSLYTASMLADTRTGGKTQYYYVVLHELGHILGIGQFWNSADPIYAPITSYTDANDSTTKYYYTGTNAFKQYKSYLSSDLSNAVIGLPIEDNGGSGTVDVHPEEGLENVFVRHKRFAEATRVAVKAWGLEILCKNPEEYSDSLTAVMVPDGHDADSLRKIILDHYNMSLGTGLAKVAGKIFRIGHLGDFNELMLAGTLAGVEMGLMKSKIPYKKGGILKALDYLC